MQEHPPPADLADENAIKRLKAAYFRLLDTKRFVELGELLTEDVTTSYEGGRLSHHGRAEVVGFLEEALGNSGMLTMHHGHHPEIDFLPGGEATGTWYLADRVIVFEADLEISGTALYEDRYRKVKGRWLISHTGYTRIFEEHRVHSTGALVSFTTMWDPPPVST